VAQPLERQFAQIPGIAQMTSTSYLGTASITIQFDLNRSIDGAANDVQGAINAASGQLPKNLPSPPPYRKVNPADSPILLLSATSAPTRSTQTISSCSPGTGTTSLSPTATADRCESEISAKLSPAPRMPSRRPGPMASAACSSSFSSSPALT